MELRHLRYFVAVAEELHFGRAAARLNIAQPPLSRQIRDLERELGAELLERVKRRVQLTPAGRAFLPEARLTLTQAERARRTAQRAARGEIGRLRIGFVEAATFSGILPEVLRFFRKHYPDVALELFELSSLQQAEALREGRIDVGLLHSPPPDAEQWLRVERILRDPLVAALPLGHRLARRARLTLRTLAPEPLLLFPRQNGPALYDRIIAAYRAAGFSPSVVQEAAQMHTLTGLVAAGLGVALVPGSIGRLRRPGVVYRPVRDLRVDMGTWAVWKLGEVSPVQASFLSVVRHTAQSRSKARASDQVRGDYRQPGTELAAIQNV